MIALMVLFGAAFTASVAWALGRLLFRRVVAGVYEDEANLLGFISGSALLSLLVFLIASVHQARRGVFLAVGAAILLAAWRYGQPPTLRQRFPSLPRSWRWLFLAGFVPFTVLYFVNAMAPEFSPDGVSYHLSFVAHYAREHGLVRIPTNMYAQLSQGMELLYLFAFTFGRHSAAALVHYTFLLVLTFSILAYYRRIERPRAGVAAALLLYATPIIGIDGTTAYIDVGVAAVLFGVFYILQVWDANRLAPLLVAAGLASGFAYAVKYTAFLAVPYALAFVISRTRRLRPALILCLCAAALIAPWIVKNILWTGNPFSPMLNTWFPNNVVHISFELGWAAQLRDYGLPKRWLLPLELTLRGDKTAGILGPVFLLLPFAFIALRCHAGRRVLVPALLFTLPYFANIGTRFTIPALPFWCVALALAFANYPRILACLAIFHCAASWPNMLHRYADPYVWSLQKIPWKQALRIEKEDTWLARVHGDYVVARLIERTVPPGSRLFAFNGKAEAYTNRDIAVSFQSASNEVTSDIFYAAFLPDFQPNLQQEFRFPQQALRKLRIVQNARAVADDDWGINELRVYSQDIEIGRDASWRFRANTNPWDIQLAFDNSPVTRWRSWEKLRPGMFVELDLGSRRPVDRVTLQGSPSQAQADLRLEAQDALGRWRTIADHAAVSALPPPGFLGKQALAEIKARGFEYILLELPESGAAEVGEQPGEWGLVEVAKAGATRIYKITLHGPVIEAGGGAL